MWERMVVLVTAFGGMLLFDGLTLRNKITKREKWIYAVLVAAALYMGVDYVVNQDWYDIYNIVEPLLGGIAKLIDDMLKVDWES
jgi:hypothetical protein